MGVGMAFDGFAKDFFAAVMIAMVLAIPGAMFYAGSMLARMAEQLRRLEAVIEDHLDEHEAWGGAERRTHERRQLERGI